MTIHSVSKVGVHCSIPKSDVVEHQNEVKAAFSKSDFQRSWVRLAARTVVQASSIHPTKDLTPLLWTGERGPETTRPKRTAGCLLQANCCWQTLPTISINRFVTIDFFAQVSRTSACSFHGSRSERRNHSHPGRNSQHGPDLLIVSIGLIYNRGGQGSASTSFKRWRRSAKCGRFRRASKTRPFHSSAHMLKTPKFMAVGRP